MPAPTASDRFFTQLKTAFYEGTFAELVLEKYQGVDRRMRAICVRQTSPRPGKQVITFIHIYEGHQTETDYALHEALDELPKLIGKTFLEAQLVCANTTYLLTYTLRGVSSLKSTPIGKTPSRPEEVTPPQDEPASEVIAAPTGSWEVALEAAAKKASVTDAMRLPSAFLAEFTQWLTALIKYSVRPSKKKSSTTGEQPFTIVQLNSGLGHLAFTLATTLGSSARVHGIEADTALVDICNRVAGSERLINLAFTKPPAAGAPGPELDVLVALAADDTDADNAFAQGIAAGASLIVVEPCGHRELHSKLSVPSVWPDAIRQEPLLAQHAGSVTDAFRCLLLACAGYKIKTLERPTSATSAPNLIIAAVEPRIRTQEVTVDAVRDFARFYGIRQQHLAKRLGISLV